MEFRHDKGGGFALDAQGDYPLLAPVTSELLLHVEALQTLFAGEQPMMIPIHPTERGKLRFFCGDASREGFGGATQYTDGTLTLQEGLWDLQFSKGGSNLRKAQNQVNHLLLEIRGGKHDGCELWAATDNSVWSSAWNKGM